MGSITAGEIKRRGMGVLDPILKAHGEATVTLRGKERYVVMTQDAYARLREAELSQAVRETRADYRAGRIADRSIQSHMKRMDNEL